MVVALEDVSAVLEPVARQAQDLSAACVITIYGDTILYRDTEASCVRVHGAPSPGAWAASASLVRSKRGPALLAGPSATAMARTAQPAAT